MSFSQPFAIDPSQFHFPVGQFTQAPLVQVWVLAAHATAEPQTPLELQVCTALPEHCVDAGSHTPAHAPFTHADATHAVLLPQVPFAEQVSTLFPLQ